MKITHNTPREPRSATLTPEYEAEVERSMERGRLRWEAEQAALAKAERRRARLIAVKPTTARQTKSVKAKIAVLDAFIEAERLRLVAIDRMMRSNSNHAPATQRGRKSFHHHPTPGSTL